jgi:hypothetical protein
MPGVPAIVLNGRLDVLGSNALGRALFPSFDAAGDQPNNARIVFLDPQSTTFFREWDKVANDTVALLRAEAGRDPYDKELSDLIGELSTRSENFRVRWAAHDVRIHNTGMKKLHHPVVGDLDLPFESLPIEAGSSISLVTYLPEPGSLPRRPRPARQLGSQRHRSPQHRARPPAPPPLSRRPPSTGGL